MSHYFFVNIHTSHASKKAMAGLKKSFDKRTLFADYAGKEHSDWDWDAGFFNATNPKEAHLTFYARGSRPPRQLFEGLQRAGFEFEARSYPETDYWYSTQIPLEDSDLPFDEVLSLENGSCLAAVLCLEIEE